MAGLDFNATTIPGEGLYVFLKRAQELSLTKVNPNTGTIALFFRAEESIKHERVVLTLALTGAGNNVFITCRVLDKDNGEAVLFEKTVVDTPEVDPTESYQPGLTNLTPDLAGMPFGIGPEGASGSFLYLAQIGDGNQPEAEVFYDNFTYEIRGPGILDIEKTIRLSWPAFSAEFVVEGAPTVEGPWTEVTEPVLQVGAVNHMTVPATPNSGMEVFRLRN